MARKHPSAADAGLDIAGPMRRNRMKTFWVGDGLRSAPPGRRLDNTACSQGCALLALGYFRTVPPGRNAESGGRDRRVLIGVS